MRRDRARAGASDILTGMNGAASSPTANGSAESDKQAAFNPESIQARILALRALVPRTEWARVPRDGARSNGQRGE